MPGPNHDFGGGVTETLLHPVVVVALIIAIVLIFTLRRKYVIAPVILFAFLVPIGQVLYVSGIHFPAIRIIVIAGWIRLLWSKIISGQRLVAGGFNGVDRAFSLCLVCQATAVTLLYMHAPALINQIAFLIDFLGAYVLMRYMIRSHEDIYRAIKCLAVVAIILGVFMLREYLTLQNAFGWLGGVKAIPDLREGRPRAQGSFQHALMAGTFAATLLPLFVLLWRNGRAKLLAAVGLVGCTLMTITSNSSTPLLAYVAAVVAICLWPLRRHMRKLRWAAVAGLVVLAMVMKAPVWFVIAHIDLTGGSSGYHRAKIVDVFITHFKDWWLIGTKDTINWGWDMWDTQNQFVNVGQTGGLLALILFLFVITRSFSRIGRGRKAVAGESKELMLWFLGAALFAHIVSFFGVNYFDQSKMGWFILLAMISAATAPLLKPHPASVRHETVPVETQLPAESGVGEALPWPGGMQL